MFIVRECDSCFSSLFSSHLLEIQDSESRDLGDCKQTIVGQLRYQIVCEHQSLQFLALAEVCEFCKISEFVVHEEDIFEVGQRVCDLEDGFDTIIGDDE